MAMHYATGVDGDRESATVVTLYAREDKDCLPADILRYHGYRDLANDVDTVLDALLTAVQGMGFHGIHRAELDAE